LFGDLAALRRLVSDNPAQVDRVDRFNTLVETYSGSARSRVAIAFVTA
jgi:hypothetical protein